MTRPGEASSEPAGTMFNPPPGWPVPLGFQPSRDWTPNPSWPAAPAGWQFWITRQQTAQQIPPYGGTPLGTPTPAQPAAAWTHQPAPSAWDLDPVAPKQTIPKWIRFIVLFPVALLVLFLIRVTIVQIFSGNVLVLILTLAAFAIGGSIIWWRNNH
jgi:hypothetical protein